MMLNAQNFSTVLLLFLGMLVFSCRESKVADFDDKYNKIDNTHFEVINPNRSFVGELNANKVVLNINSKVDGNIVFGTLYYPNEVDPYESMKYFKGKRIHGELQLDNKNSKITGTIIETGFKGELSANGKISELNLTRHKDYSNGNIYYSNGSISERISLLGLEDDEVCQGQLFDIGHFKKNNHNYLLYYFVYPSTGIFKARGNCGNGIESLIAVLKCRNDIKKTEVEVIAMQSCYNAIECFIGEDDLNQNNLIDVWKLKNELKIKKVDLRKDSPQIITINPNGAKVIDFVDEKD